MNSAKDGYVVAFERRQQGGSKLFGATQTIKNDMLESIRRVDILTSQADEMVRNTAMHTAKAASHASSKIPLSCDAPPPTWRDSWLTEQPTANELLLATHTGAGGLDEFTLWKHRAP